MHTISEKSDAQMAESVDALVSNTSRFTPVPVRPRLWVLKERNFRFSLFLFLRIEVARANRALSVWLVFWVSANKLAIPNKLTTGYALSRHTTHIHTAAVLTLICGCTNKVRFIARPGGLRYEVFVRVLRTSTPALGTPKPL